MDAMRRKDLAYALVRFTIGMLFFFYGVGKFLQGLDPTAESISQRFAESPLPVGLAEAFATVLPFLEVAIGALLMLGLFTRVGLVAALVLLAILTFGTVLEPSPPTVAHNANLTFITAALLFLLEYNGFSVDRARGRGGRPPIAETAR